MKYYAGIGSRETPDEALQLIRGLAASLAGLGWTLRSGAAGGADKTFEEGCDSVNGDKQIFLPWKNFNNHPSPLYFITHETMRVAQNHHPSWHYLSQGARRLHARNVYQVLGYDLQSRSSFVLCWTPKGAKVGGTSQAIRIADAYQVPVFNLGLPAVFETFKTAYQENAWGTILPSEGSLNSLPE